MARRISSSRYFVAWVLLVVGVVSLPAALYAQEAARGFASPVQLFDSYKKAKNGQHWMETFALFTIERQNIEVSQIAALAAGDPKQRALLKSQGMSWEEVDQELKALEQPGQFGGPSGLAAVSRMSAPQKAAIYSSANEYIAAATQQNAEIVEILRGLKVDGERAEGECSGTRRFVESQTDPATKMARQVLRSATFRETIRFRRTAGSWFVD